LQIPFDVAVLAAQHEEESTLDMADFSQAPANFPQVPAQNDSQDEKSEYSYQDVDSDKDVCRVHCYGVLFSIRTPATGVFFDYIYQECQDLECASHACAFSPAATLRAGRG
jgi:hypothetical protein